MLNIPSSYWRTERLPLHLPYYFIPFTSLWYSHYIFRIFFTFLSFYFWKLSTPFDPRNCIDQISVIVLAHERENFVLQLLLIQIIAGKGSSNDRLPIGDSRVPPTSRGILAVRSPPANIGCVIESLELSLFGCMLKRLISWTVSLC